MQTNASIARRVEDGEVDRASDCQSRERQFEAHRDDFYHLST